MQRLTFSFQGVEFPAILLDKGEWIFSANVVCIECELVTNQNHISRYLQRAVPAQYYFEFNPQDGGRPGYYLKLPGMFRLLLLANTEKGEDFKYWVCDKVLPNLFENNSYVDEENITLEQLAKLKQRTEEIEQLKLDKARLELEKQVLTEEHEIEANVLLTINDEKTRKINKLERDLYDATKPFSGITIANEKHCNENIERTYSEKEYQKLKKENNALKNEIDKYKRKESFASKLDQLMRFVLTSRPTPLRKQIMLLFGWNEKTSLPKDNF